LSFFGVLLAALLLVVATLHLLQLAGQPLDFVLVLVDLSLVHVELGCHCLHLVGLLLEVLLVNAELLGDLGARLASEQILELNIQLLLLLNNHVLLDDLLGLLDEALLECLDLLEHFPSVWVSALQLAPAVVVERIFEFLRQSLDGEAFRE